MRRFPIKTLGNDDYNRTIFCKDFGDSFNFLEMRYTKRGRQSRVSEISKKLKIAQKPKQKLELSNSSCNSLFLETLNSIAGLSLFKTFNKNAALIAFFNFFYIIFKAL